MGEITEHAIQMSGGGFHVRNSEPYIERVYPLAEWIVNEQKHGKVWRSKIVVVEGLA
jgi:hypothetical protein